MNERDVRRWREAAFRIWALTGEPGAASRAKARMTRYFNNLPADLEEWDDVARAPLLSGAKGTRERFEYQHLSNVLKAVRMAYAVEFGRPDVIGRGEREFLQAALGTRFEAEPALPPVASGSGFLVEFAFDWTEPHSRGRSRTVADRASAWVERVDEADAPPAFALPTDGEDFVVRSVGDALFRPVRSPGSCVPATEARFVEACEGRECWRDDPFHERYDRHHGPFEWGTPADGTSDVGRRDAAAEKGLLRAGRLVSIGGIVHRSTTAPVMRIMRREAYGDHALDLHWRCGTAHWPTEDGPLPAETARKEFPLDLGGFDAVRLPCGKAQVEALREVLPRIVAHNVATDEARWCKVRTSQDPDALVPRLPKAHGGPADADHVGALVDWLLESATQPLTHVPEALVPMLRKAFEGGRVERRDVASAIEDLEKHRHCGASLTVLNAVLDAMDGSLVPSADEDEGEERLLGSGP